MKIVGMEQFQNICRHKLAEWFERNYSPDVGVTFDRTFIVWSCKTLQNYKCLVSTAVCNGIYAEYTYNGDKCELYEDIYKKLSNTCFSDLDEV